MSMECVVLANVFAASALGLSWLIRHYKHKQYTTTEWRAKMRKLGIGVKKCT